LVLKLRVEEAVGHKLAHDVIQYSSDIKAVIFKRGHVISDQDIELLKNTGNYYVYVESPNTNGVHEDEAAFRLMRASAGDNTFLSRPNKGRINAFASVNGILRVKTDVLREVNSVPNFILVTRRDYSLVKRGELVASGKIVPLFVTENAMKTVEGILGSRGPVVKILPPIKRTISAVITGTEIYEGRTEDKFVPALNSRLEKVGLGLNQVVFVPDSVERIKEAILDCAEKSDIVLVCGGMAVDAGDVTPDAIVATGADIVTRGVPVFPGSMLMLAYLRSVPIVGLPACVIPDKMTSFDLILPRLLLGDRIGKKDLVKLAHGGLL
jgi:molybdopterin biosynthesis enzyme